MRMRRIAVRKDGVASITCVTPCSSIAAPVPRIRAINSPSPIPPTAAQQSDAAASITVTGRRASRTVKTGIPR